SSVENPPPHSPSSNAAASNDARARNAPSPAQDRCRAAPQAQPRRPRQSHPPPLRNSQPATAHSQAPAPARQTWASSKIHAHAPERTAHRPATAALRASSSAARASGPLSTRRASLLGSAAQPSRSLTAWLRGTTQRRPATAEPTRGQHLRSKRRQTY